MSDVLELRAATVDLARREVRRRDGGVHPLSELEVALLAYLSAHPGDPVHRDVLLIEVWGFPRPVPTRAVDNTVSRLRSKVEADAKAPAHLKTIRGRGYVLDLPAAPRATAAAPPTDGAPRRLAVPPAPFFGRGPELAQLSDLVGRRRLVTVLAPGGAGKTRLVARWLDLADLPIHAALSLAHVVDRDGLIQAVAEALGVALAATARDPAVLARALAARGPGVLVLDNLEQLVPSLPGSVDRWVAEAPQLRVLTTSRRVLGLPGEAHMTLGALDADDALTLFEARLADADPELALSASDRMEVRALLQRVEHHALCVELLASRAAALGVAEVARRLGSILLHAEHGSAAADHHRSLQATLDWSWELLAPAEQEALAALSCLGGAFDLALATAVLARDAAPDLSALRKASLLEREQTATGALRFHLLLPVREYARRHLARRVDLAAIHQRFAQAMQARVEAAAGLSDAAHTRAMATERGNLLAAGEAIADEAPGLAALLLLVGRGGDAPQVTERADPYERIVALAERSEDRVLWARARASLARWHELRGDNDRALSVLDPVLQDSRAGGGHPAVLITRASCLRSCDRFREALEELERLDALDDASDAERAQALCLRGTVLQLTGDWEASEAAFRAGIALAVRRRQPRGERLNRANLASLLLRFPDRVADARNELARARAIAAEWGFVPPWLDNLLAWMDLSTGELDDVRRRAEAALQRARQVGDAETAQHCLGTLTWVALLQGDLDESERMLLDGLDITRRRGSATYAAPLLVSLAVVAARRRDLPAAEGWLAELDGCDLPDLASDMALGIALERRVVDLARADQAQWPALVADVRAELSHAQALNDQSYISLVARLVEVCIDELRPARRG